MSQWQEIMSAAICAVDPKTGEDFFTDAELEHISNETCCHKCEGSGRLCQTCGESTVFCDHSGIAYPCFRCKGTGIGEVTLSLLKPSPVPHRQARLDLH